MNPKRHNVYWTTGRVIGWIDDVLKVQTGENILNHGCVVVHLSNPLGRIGDSLACAGIVANEIGNTACLEVATTITR